MLRNEGQYNVVIFQQKLHSAALSGGFNIMMILPYHYGSVNLGRPNEL